MIKLSPTPDVIQSFCKCIFSRQRKLSACLTITSQLKTNFSLTIYCPLNILYEQQLNLNQVRGYFSTAKATLATGPWTSGPSFFTHNKWESMCLWLHVNYRQFFQGQRGWGGGSVSMHSTRMNGRKHPEKLYPDIFLWFPRKQKRMDGVRWQRHLKHTHTHTK